MLLWILDTPALLDLFSAPAAHRGVVAADLYFGNEMLAYGHLITWLRAHDLWTVNGSALHSVPNDSASRQHLVPFMSVEWCLENRIRKERCGVHVAGVHSSDLGPFAPHFSVDSPVTNAHRPIM